jgi:hypothetical protein
MTVSTDKVDVDEKISLYEYGVIRNPKTGKTVLCTNTNDYLYEGAKPKVKVMYISLDDVFEKLNEVDIGFYSWIGSSKIQVMLSIAYNNLAIYINMLNNWNGSFYEE